MRFYSVKQEKILVMPANGVVLTTGGLSTCICMLLKGHVNGKPYLAMYHWDGFSVIFNRHSSYWMMLAESTLYAIFQRVAEKIIIKMSSEGKPGLDAIYFIGGERASDLVSGTEQEAEALRLFSKKICDHLFLTTSHTRHAHHFFLTDGSEVIRLFFSMKKIIIDKGDEFDSDVECENNDIDSVESSDSDESSNSEQSDQLELPCRYI